MPTCKLCQQSVAKLADCHLYPRSLTRKLAGKENKVFNASIVNGPRVSWANGGVHDRNIICVACEQKFGPVDQYALEFRERVKQGVASFDIEFKSSRLRTFEADSEKLHAFAINTLVRWHLSGQARLSPVSLGEFADEAIASVQEGKSLLVGGPEVSYHFFTSDLALNMLDPYLAYSDKIGMWVLHLPHMHIYIALETKLPEWLFPAILKPGHRVTVWRQRRPPQSVLEIIDQIEGPNTAAILKMFGRTSGA